MYFQENLQAQNASPDLQITYNSLISLKETIPVREQPLNDTNNFGQASDNEIEEFLGIDEPLPATQTGKSFTNFFILS